MRTRLLILAFGTETPKQEKTKRCFIYILEVFMLWSLNDPNIPAKHYVFVPVRYALKCVGQSANVMALIQNIDLGVCRSFVTAYIYVCDLL